MTRGGFAAGGAALALPMSAKSQTPIVFRFQSTWPAKDIFHEYAQDYARRVNGMAGGSRRPGTFATGEAIAAIRCAYLAPA